MLVSLITGLAYRSDKQRAQAGEWRISEATLHFLDLLGGWPGGFLAQRWCRHKTAKASFQVVFWLTVAIHQFIAVDSLLHWKVLGQSGPLLEKALHASGR